MKKILNMKLWQKIVIVFLLVILFNTIVVKPVQAAVEADILLKPITGLFVGLADALEGVMQKIVLRVDESLIEVKDTPTNFFVNVLVIGAFIVGTAIAIIMAVPTGSASIVAWGAFLVKSALTIAISCGAYALVGSKVTTLISQMIGSEFDFPQFALSPYEIFDNKISVLDINFFNPKPYQVVVNGEGKIIDAKDIIKTKKEQIGKYDQSIVSNGTKSVIYATIEDMAKLIYDAEKNQFDLTSTPTIEDTGEILVEDTYVKGDHHGYDVYTGHYKVKRTYREIYKKRR